MTDFDEKNLTEKEIEVAKSVGRKRAEFLFQIGQIAFAERMAELQLEQLKAQLEASEREKKRIDELLARGRQSFQVAAEERSKEMAQLRENFKGEVPEYLEKIIQDIESES